nr:type I restriction enzyme endonuclease domain-containing protein [Bradyrhizobium sp. AUGA SZCCT0431]
MNTMYVDKPMRGHGLMQAIARVNRVFRDKLGGLIVDYIGILQNLKNALKDYSPSDQEKTGIDEEVAVAALHETFEKVKAIFHGHDYSRGISGTPQQRLHSLAGAMDWVLKWQEQNASRARDPDDKKRQHRAYQDMVLELTKAYALERDEFRLRRIRRFRSSWHIRLA